MRQAADKSDRIDQHDGAAVRQCERARGRVKRGEQLILSQHARAGQRVEQRALADVRITDDRHRRHALLFAPRPQQAAALFQLRELLLQSRNPPPDMPPVRFKLRLARPARADAAAQARKRLPHAAKPRQPVS